LKADLDKQLGAPEPVAFHTPHKAVAETLRRVWGTENLFGGPKVSE